MPILKNTQLNQKGAVPLLVLVGVVGLLGFLVVSSTSSFKDRFFSSLYSPPPFSHAATSDIYISTAGSDFNPGTQVSPFKTIQKATSIVQPGTTVHVAPGTYSGQVVSSTNGTVAARIKYVSDTKWGAKLVTSGVNPSWHQYGSYTDIVGFDVSGDSYIGIENEALDNVKVIGNHVHDITAHPCTNQLGGAGIAISNYAGQNHETIGNVVHDVWDKSYSGPCELTHGIYEMTKGGKVLNNIVYRNQGWGIETWHWATGLTMSNNLVFDNGIGGIIVGEPFSEGSPLPQPPTADNFTVSNNISVYNHGGSGFPSGIREAGKTGLNNKYLNNIVFGNTNGDILLQNGLVAQNTQTVDPNTLFVNWKLDGTGDYHLKSGSLAIDKGTATGAAVDDLDANTRPQGAGFDIGPYEYKVSASPTPNPLPGDINGSKKVDIFDYNLLITDYGATSGLGLRSDINKSGKVDILDYNLLISNFGKSIP